MNFRLGMGVLDRLALPITTGSSMRDNNGYNNQHDEGRSCNGDAHNRASPGYKRPLMQCQQLKKMNTHDIDEDEDDVMTAGWLRVGPALMAAWPVISWP